MENVQQRRKRAREKAIPIPVCLTRPLIIQLDRAAEREGVYGRSAIIRRACILYLEQRAREQGEHLAPDRLHSEEFVKEER